MAESAAEEANRTVAGLTQEVDTRWSAIEKLDTELTVSWRQITINERSRFQLWSNNLGACHPLEVQESADHRLRAAPDVHRRIVQLLEELCEGLDDIREVQSGEREGGEEEEKEEEEETDVSTFSGDDETTNPRSEISELWLMVGDVITSLLKLSVLVRQSSSRNKLDRASRAVAKATASSEIMTSDVEHVRYRFPKLEANQWLLQRLGEASTQRRRFLLYAQDHERQLASVAKESTSGPTEASSRAATVLPAKFDISFLEDLDGANAASTTLFSRGWNVDDRREVVPLSFVCVDGQPAICPYCRDTVHFKTGKAWRRHVFDDLKAYICTFEECDHGPFRSRTAWAIHEQRQHLRSWKCPFCHEDFDTRALVAEHVPATYPSMDQNLLSDLIYAASPQVERVPMSQCPFCDDPVPWEGEFERPMFSNPQRKAHEQYIMRGEPVSVSLYHQHMSHHMEQLALFAVPALAHDDEDSATGDHLVTDRRTMNRRPIAPSLHYDGSRGNPSGSLWGPPTENPSTDRNKHSSMTARQWFIPGDGIDRLVIVADVQRYLGNDAFVRPGQGTGENEGVMGYWINAYSNLTTVMMAQLRSDSAKWRQEQRTNPAIGDYVGSSTYYNSEAARVQGSDGRDFEAVERPYGVSVSGSRDQMSAERMPIDRMPVGRMPVDRMPTDRIPVNRMPWDMGPVDRMPPQLYARSNTHPPSTDYGAPPGYVRQGNYYVPISSAEQPMRMESAPELHYPLDLQNDPRDLRDPRIFGYAQDYSQDPRYAYPAPAATTASLPRSERDTVVNTVSPRYARQGNYYAQVPASASQRLPSPPEEDNDDDSQPVRDPYYGRGGSPPTRFDSTRNVRRRM